MKINRRWLIGVLLIIALAAFVGCSNNDEELSDREVFEKAFMQNLERHSFEFSAEMGLIMEDLNMPNQALGAYMGAFNNIAMNFDGKIDGEDPVHPEAYFTGQINSAGLGVALEMYILDEQIAIKAPMMAQILGDQRLADGYILMDLEEDFYNQEGYEEMDPEDREALYGMFQQFGEIYMEIVEEEFITNNGETEVTIDGQDVDVTEYEIYMGREEIRTVLESIPELVEDESFRELVYDALRISNTEITQQEAEEKMDTIQQDYDQQTVDELMAELEETLDLDQSSFTMTLFIDQDYRIVKENYDVLLVVQQEQQSFSMQILGTMEYWNINGDIDIDAPEFTDQNSVPMQDLMFAPGF